MKCHLAFGSYFPSIHMYFWEWEIWKKKKKARGGVAISPHPPDFMVFPFGPCVFVSGRRRGRWERERGKGPSPGSGTAYLIPPITVIVCWKQQAGAWFAQPHPPSNFVFPCSFVGPLPLTLLSKSQLMIGIEWWFRLFVYRSRFTWK